MSSTAALEFRLPLCRVSLLWAGLFSFVYLVVLLLSCGRVVSVSCCVLVVCCAVVLSLLLCALVAFTPFVGFQPLVDFFRALLPSSS